MAAASSPANAAVAASAKAKSRGIGAAGTGGTRRCHPRMQRRLRGSGLSSGSQCSTPAKAFSSSLRDGRPAMYAVWA